MEIQFASLDETATRFTLSGASPAFANAMRRAMISDVPTLAIEDVRIYDNTSALFDEMLAHRLGLIPIRTDLDTYVARENCSCGGAGCPGCTVTFTLSAEGPRTVTSGDLIPQDVKTVPVSDNIPIVKLTKGQKLVLEARAVLGTGKDHAKWQATLVCGYKNHPAIAITDACDACGMCVDECPRDILVIKGKKSRNRCREAAGLFTLQAVRAGMHIDRHRGRTGDPGIRRTRQVHLCCGKRRVALSQRYPAAGAAAHQGTVRRAGTEDTRNFRG